MRRLLIGAITLSVIYGCFVLSRPRKSKPKQPDEVNTWEGEGGAFPAEPDRTAAQTEPESQPV